MTMLSLANVLRRLPVSHFAKNLPATKLAEISWSFECPLDGGVREISGFSKIAEHEKGKTKFHGFYAGGFYVNNIQVPGSVIAQSDIYLMWKPRRMEEVTLESLSFLDLITPVPEILVMGCGPHAQPLPKEISKFLMARNIRAEVLGSKDATGYFNVLNEEGRMVVGALLTIDPTVPLAESMPEQKDPLHDRPFIIR